MRLPCILTLGSASVVLAEDQPRNQKPLFPHPGTVTTPPQKFMSCSKTYGPDWKTCGDEATSRFCYSPAQGQSCCAVDNGYCEKGTWCAPVAGYCCLDGENLESCAQSAGFELPGSESSYLPSLKRSVSLLEDREVVVGEVKVSVAVKKKTLVGLGLGMGVAGLLMLSC